MTVEQGVQEIKQPFDLQELTKLAQTGDPFAMTDLWEWVQPVLFWYFYRAFDDSDTADDLCQEVGFRFLTAIRETTSSITNVFGFCQTIAFRVKDDHLRKKYRDPLTRATGITHANEPELLVDDDVWRDRVEWFRRELEKLPDDDRQIIKLTLRGLTQVEIAEKMDVTDRTVRNRLYNIIEVFKQRVECDSSKL